ncbi:MAG: GAF domain-containing sensor histidine kinase [Myxococcaceae bacterium]
MVAYPSNERSDHSDREVLEERLARMSVLREFTVATFELFDPATQVDGFLERVAERLNCSVALLLSGTAEEGVRLVGAAGLSRVSRSLPLRGVDLSEPDPMRLALPYPELSTKLSGWRFPFARRPGEKAAEGSVLLLFFAQEPLPQAQYRGMVERLVERLATALWHRHLLAETLEHERRANFLAEVRTLLTSLADYEAVLPLVAHLAVPFLGEWCLIEERGAEGSALRSAAMHSDPSKVELVRKLEGWDRGMLTTTRPVVLPAITPDLLEPGRWPELGVQTAEQAAALRELGVRSIVSVPLVTRGLTLGSITLGSGKNRAPGAGELALAEDLARRAAQALDNARLFRGAEEAVQARDEFISIASHELRTPLTSMSLAVQGLVRARAEDPTLARSETLQKATELLDRQTKRLAKLVGDLLDVSRIRAGRLNLNLEQVDLAELVGGLVAGMQDNLEHAGCVIRLSTQGNVVGRWDRLRLTQVATNLLSNAAKFGAGKPIEVAVTADEAWARLTVTDEGPGIAAEHQALIFERFEHPVPMRPYGGLGLGLYVARRVVQALGGSIRVKSAPGRGSTFTVELPLGGPPRGGS